MNLAALRRLTQPRPAQQRCELCAAPAAEEHQHLVDPDARRLVCVCDACAILFDHNGATRYRRVPRDVRDLRGLDLDDALWSRLAIPIGLVFFFRSSVSKSVLGVYPSPGGPTETVIEPELWNDLAALHPALAAMPEDVEALLVNRVSGAREYFIVPIDECYKLSGVIRTHWTGFSGGDELWDRLALFFARLRSIDAPEAQARVEESHA